MFEMSATTREPPKLSMFLYPALTTVDFSKMCMIHITSPYIVSTCWPFQRYLIIFWWRYQAEETLLERRAVSLELFSSRYIQAQLVDVSDVVTREVLVELRGTHIHPSFGGG